WHGWVSMGLKRDGARDRRHVSGARESDVRRKARALEAQRDERMAAEAGRAPRTDTWLVHYVDVIAAHRVRPRTLDGYRAVIRNHLIPALGHHRLDRLQPEHVEALYADLESQGLAPATVLQVHRILSRALKVAVQRGRVARNVATLVDAPSVRRHEIKPLDPAEARRILDTAAEQRNAARWAVALALGLRQGEALRLRWSDVDLDAGAVTVRAALQRRRWKHGCESDCGRRPAACPARHGGGLVFGPPKSDAAQRTISVPAQLVDGLRRHRVEQAAERLAAGNLWDDHELVVCQPTGRPIDPTADYRTWQKLLAAAGVRRARLHDARHTAISLWKIGRVRGVHHSAVRVYVARAGPGGLRDAAGRVR
ncbi:MAG: tyrosine-type recombinase/integrase, partial [Frankiaceae bacterium]